MRSYKFFWALFIGVFLCANPLLAGNTERDVANPGSHLRRVSCEAPHISALDRLDVLRSQLDNTFQSYSVDTSAAVKAHIKSITKLLTTGIYDKPSTIDMSVAEKDEKKKTTALTTSYGIRKTPANLQEKTRIMQLLGHLAKIAQGAPELSSFIKTELQQGIEHFAAKGSLTEQIHAHLVPLAYDFIETMIKPSNLLLPSAALEKNSTSEEFKGYICLQRSTAKLDKKRVLQNLNAYLGTFYTDKKTITLAEFIKLLREQPLPKAIDADEKLKKLEDIKNHQMQKMLAEIIDTLERDNEKLSHYHSLIIRSSNDSRSSSIPMAPPQIEDRSTSPDLASPPLAPVIETAVFVRQPTTWLITPRKKKPNEEKTDATTPSSNEVLQSEPTGLSALLKISLNLRRATMQHRMFNDNDTILKKDECKADNDDWGDDTSSATSHTQRSARRTPSTLQQKLAASAPATPTLQRRVLPMLTTPATPTAAPATPTPVVGRPVPIIPQDTQIPRENQHQGTANEEPRSAYLAAPSTPSSSSTVGKEPIKGASGVVARAKAVFNKPN